METRNRYGERIASDLKLLVVLGRCMHAIERRLFPHITEAGLTPSQFEVLEVLYHKGCLTVGEVIDKTLSSSGNVAVIVDNLAKEGLVKKRVDSEDRRVRLIELTEKGRERIAGYFPEHASEIQAAFSHLTREEKDILTALLKKLGKGV